MIVIMQTGSTDSEVQNAIEKLIDMGLDVHRSTGASQTVLGVVGDTHRIDVRAMEVLDGVHKVIRITEPYKLAGRVFRREDTVISVGDAVIGGKEVSLIAGPSAVESREQINEIAAFVKSTGTRFLRGGVFKPFGSPYAYHGLGEQGFKYLREAADNHGLAVVSEVQDQEHIALALQYVDILLVGSRNMQNFPLLQALGKIDKPVLLKRGMSATLKELLMAAEYIMAGGNHRVILCERGIRTFESYTRNTLDLSAIPVLEKLTHLPVVVDPSHATGVRDKVPPLARAAIAARADGLLIEVHPDPDKALVNGAQTLYYDQYEKLVREIQLIAGAVGRAG